MLHTFNTLDHVCMMAPHLALHKSGATPASGRSISSDYQAPEKSETPGESSGESPGENPEESPGGPSSEFRAMVAPAMLALTLEVPMRRRRQDISLVYLFRCGMFCSVMTPVQHSRQRPRRWGGWLS